MELLDPRPGETILELAAGPGDTGFLALPRLLPGGRLVTTLSNEMRRRDVQFGLISVCAQGGMGFAMVLERR